MSQRFFGQPESPLFGVYHAARGRNKSGVRAVVICPPIGQEYIRTHWGLRLLASQLARAGVHVLRFDYHGIGDSTGTVEQVDALDVWKQNIKDAIDHVKQISNAETVMLIGQRFGGTLAAEVASERTDVNSVVLWEPIADGNEYLESLRKMHSTMVDLWVCKMKTPDDEYGEEILGSYYRRSLLEEMAEARLCERELILPQLIIDVESEEQKYSHIEPSLQKVIIEENEGSWSDLRVLETARLRPKTTRTIAKTVKDMFARLDKFGALDSMELKQANDSTPEAL